LTDIVRLLRQATRPHTKWCEVSAAAAWTAIEESFELCALGLLNKKATPPSIKPFIINATNTAASLEEIWVFMVVSDK
jgi:hypothetical protein